MKQIGKMIVIAGCLMQGLWAANSNPGSWLSFQGLLLNASGQRMADGNYFLCFHLFETASGGAFKWEECDSVSVVDGFYQAKLGDQFDLPLQLGKPAFLEVSVDGDIMVGRVPLTGAVRAWSASAVSDTVLPSAGIGPGLTVRSLNGITDEVQVKVEGALSLQVREDTLLLSAEDAFDAKAQEDLASATAHVDSPHRMFSDDTMKVRAERLGDSTKAGLISPADWNLFNSKGDVKALGTKYVKYIPYTPEMVRYSPPCDSRNEGMVTFRSRYRADALTGALLVCIYDGGLGKYAWHALD